MFRKSSAALALALAASLISVTTPTQAAPKPDKDEVYLEITISQATYDPATGQRGDDQFVAFETTKPGTIVPLTNGSGEYTISSPSGCKAVTMTNTSRSVLFNTVLFRFITVTSWCYNRNNRTISDVGTSWRIEDVASTYDWRGINNKDLRFYAWISGSSTSGYKHYRQGKFANCVLEVGCTGNEYPANTLWAHSNGTYAWDYNL